jgi:sugar/nucleoside kinase (ribokinase family)
MEVISFGWVFLEIVFGHFDRLPLPGEEIYVDSFGISCGGAVTFAVEASRAGADVGLATVLGDDMGSRLVEDHARQDKVDLSVSKRLNGPAAGITVVLNYDGDRSFISHMPPRPAEEVREADRWLAILREVRPAWCYMHPGRHSLPVFKEARALGTRVALDVNFGEIDDYADVVVECARLADVFLPNEEELMRITKSTDLAGAIDLASSWCPLMVVKRGGAGAIAVERGRATEVTDGLRDVVVKDRTGAGDAFAGALVGTLVRGAGFLEAVAAGNAAGSEAVARLGALGELRHPGREHRL